VHSVAQCSMCHLEIVSFYPVSQSADLLLCTSRIRSLRLMSHFLCRHSLCRGMKNMKGREECKILEKFYGPFRFEF